MNRYTVTLGALLIFSTLLGACGPASDPSDKPGCGLFGCREPEPGVAKFSVGSADALRWDGVHGCRDYDVNVGKDGDGRRRIAGTVMRSEACDPETRQGSFEFVYRQLTTELFGWTAEAAYRPLDEDAANVLLDACTWETRPKPIFVIGQWWDSAGLGVESQYRDFIGNLTYATLLLPFDDDGFERLGEEVVDGVPTIAFQNDSATVWMINDGSGKSRPLRVVGNHYDVTFTDWDVAFEVAMPGELRSLSEVCAVRQR